MSDFRRRLLRKENEIYWGRPATGVYVIDPPAQYNSKDYNMRITINNSDYYYDSDYPFFVRISSSGGYIIMFARDHTYRNGVLYNSGNLGNYIINGVEYRLEWYNRTQTLYSNKPVYIWEV